MPSTPSDDDPGEDTDPAEPGSVALAGDPAGAGEEPPSPDEGADPTAGERGEEGGDDEEEPPTHVAFELAEWGARERTMLDNQLGALGVPRAWEASTLVVNVAHADVVDDLIDEIEERVALDLPPGVETVTYEVGDWPSGLEDRFVEALIEARVPHQSGYREIAVAADDEERVDALVEAVTQAWEDEQLTEEELDGPDAQQVLSELYIGADRLQHDASDRAATVRFDDAAELLELVGLPFGFAQSEWDGIAAGVAGLRQQLADVEATDEQIRDAARDLRTQLRPLV